MASVAWWALSDVLLSLYTYNKHDALYHQVRSVSLTFMPFAQSFNTNDSPLLVYVSGALSYVGSRTFLVQSEQPMM